MTLAIKNPLFAVTLCVVFASCASDSVQQVTLSGELSRVGFQALAPEAEGPVPAF